MNISLQEAITERHSVRKYKDKALEDNVIEVLQQAIETCNRDGNLRIQLVLDEPKGFSGIQSYGAFSNVRNYLAMTGERASDLEERIGYYGEQLVLLAQQLGLGTCWVGGPYRKVAGAYDLNDRDKLVCVIALGYPDQPGRVHRSKTAEQVSNVSEQTPDWFHRGVTAALLAPTAVNQQKFHFEYVAATNDSLPTVKATRTFSLIGYTKLDLGIAKLHFEIGAGKDNFIWG